VALEKVNSTIFLKVQVVSKALFKKDQSPLPYFSGKGGITTKLKPGTRQLLVTDW
jgi:hypothetical protein